MARRLVIIFAGTLCLSLAACTRHQRLLGRRDLIKYINNPDHGLIRKAAVEDADVRLSFEPSSLLVAHDLTTSGIKDATLLDSLTKKYSRNYYFLLKFSKNNKELIRQLGSFDQYSEMVQVLSFRMQQFLNVTTDRRDTIQMSDYAFEQTYGVSNANTLLIAFPKNRVDSSNRFDVNLAECGFGIGSLKFNFNQRDLERAPGLDFTRVD